MKAHGLLAPHRPASRPAHAHDGTIVTEQVDEIWGGDMTETVTTAEGRAYVLIAVDHCSGEFVGAHAASDASRWEALEPIRQGVAKHFGSLDAGAATGLILRHDHGSNYMSNDFQREVKFLGITSSPAFVRQPEGNGVAERAIRTPKEQLLWVRALRHDRAAPSRAGRVRSPLQRKLAARAARAQDTQSDPGRADRP
jgi:putative transposase